MLSVDVLGLSFTNSIITNSITAQTAYAKGISMQEKHNYNKDFPIIHLSKHDLTMKKGQSETLKASLLPGGKSLSVTWKSSNPQIAKVSNAGKVTAVAPGIVKIAAYNKNYFVDDDQTGSSNECWVTVQGGTNDAKPLGTSDLTYSYGETKFKIPTSKYDEALANVKKNIGGYDYYSEEYCRAGLLFGSKDASKAHTYIYTYKLYVGESYGYGFIAREKSPIKTSRGITIGAKKDKIQQKYGLPFYTYQYTEAGKTYEIYDYVIKAAGNGLSAGLSFQFLKSKGTVSEISFSLIETNK